MSKFASLHELGKDNEQYLLIKFDKQFVRVSYSDPDNINDFVRLYIDRLKSAK